MDYFKQDLHLCVCYYCITNGFFDGGIEICQMKESKHYDVKYSFLRSSSLTDDPRVTKIDKAEFEAVYQIALASFSKIMATL